MILQSHPSQALWPFLLYGAAVILLVSGMLIVAYFLGERHREIATDTKYESGIKPTGPAHLRFPIHFYLVAMFFVVFDVASAFIIAWSISIREVGWTGFISISIFIGILLCLLLYIVKMGAFDFGPDGKKILKAYHKMLQKDG